MVVPSGLQYGRPAGWLDTDCCVVDEIILDPEMSPIVSVRSAAGPAFLPTKSEVLSLAVLAGGVIAAAAPLAMVRTVTARVSVLPDVGSELPMDSDAAVVCTVRVDEVLDDALDTVGESVSRLCVPMDSEETLPALQDECSVMSFLVWPAAVLTSHFFCLMMIVVIIDSHW